MSGFGTNGLSRSDEQGERLDYFLRYCDQWRDHEQQADDRLVTEPLATSAIASLRQTARQWRILAEEQGRRYTADIAIDPEGRRWLAALGIAEPTGATQ